MTKIFNLSDMPNARIESDLLASVKKRHPEWENKFKFNTVMGDVFASMYMNNPTWRFELERSYLSGSEVMELRQINVTCEGEHIGYLKSEYFRGNYGVEIVNHRIPNGRIRTSDAKRAMTTIKKYFVKRNSKERLDTADDAATNTLRQEYDSKLYPMRNREADLMRSMFKFVMNNCRSAYEAQCKVHEPKNLTLLDEYDKLVVDMETIDSVRSKYGSNEAALVVLDQGKYIVKTGDNVQLFDDNDLPVQIRGRLGLLKLVEDKQMVTGAGCRVSEEVFVVLLDDEGEVK